MAVPSWPSVWVCSCCSVKAKKHPAEKGFAFFQRFLREQGIIKELENMGIEDGDTVRMYDFEFDYYK